MAMVKGEAGYLGRVVVEGHSFLITALSLRKGKEAGLGCIEICFTVRGPQVPLNGPLTIFGEDGAGICQGQVFDIPEVHPGFRLDFHYELVLGAMAEGPALT